VYTLSHIIDPTFAVLSQLDPLIFLMCCSYAKDHIYSNCRGWKKWSSMQSTRVGRYAIC